MQCLVASPCSNPELPLNDALAAYSEIGYRKFEAFTGWCKSALDWRNDPAEYLKVAKRYGMAFTSLHLPPVDERIEESLKESIAAARFAEALGAGVVLFKAKSREIYKRAAKPFLDATQSLKIAPVLQNHHGTPISSLEDFREVLDGIADSRMKTLFEVGHFHKAGVPWRDGYGLLRDSIRLVHIKDMSGPNPVPFGTGEVDLPALFRHLRGAGYRGDYVVEMEVARNDTQRTLQLLKEAYAWLNANCKE